MKLTQDQIVVVRKYLRRQRKTIPSEILAGIELGLWIESSGIDLGSGSSDTTELLVDEKGQMVLLSGQFGANTSLTILNLFAAGELPYLMVRKNSWECYILCGDEILYETCEEDQDATKVCCELLRSKCPSKHPKLD